MHLKHITLGNALQTSMQMRMIQPKHCVRHAAGKQEHILNVNFFLFCFQIPMNQMDDNRFGTWILIQIINSDI